MRAARHAMIACLSTLGACTAERGPAPDTAVAATTPPSQSAAPATPAPSTKPATDSAARPATSDMTLAADGIDGVKAGMTVAQLLAASGEKLSLPAGGCGYIRPNMLPPGVRLLVQDAHVVRIDVDSGAVRTAEGFGVGSKEAELVKAYGARAKVGPHKYTGPKGHYVRVTTPGDDAHLILFETDGTAVTKMRSGQRDAVELVEGCG